MENKCLSNQNSFPENIILETVAEQNEQEVNSEPDFTFPPIAGFWRRFFAWLVDMLILGVTGQILGLIFSTFLFSLGPYGRPIELLFVVPYFGIMNSKIGGGQTIGKRLFKLSVRNQNNETIGLGRSIVRNPNLIHPRVIESMVYSNFSKQNYYMASIPYRFWFRQRNFIYDDFQSKSSPGYS